MRNLYFLLSVLLTTHFSTSAQRQVNLQMLGTRVGSSATNTQPMNDYHRLNYDNKTPYFFAFVFKNLGPDPLKKFDTVTVSYVDGTTYTGNHFIANAGDTIVFVPNGLNNKIFYIPFGTSLPSSDTMYWCDTVWVSATPTNGPLVDPDPTNNATCHWVEAYYDWRLAVNDISSQHSELQLFPNPATTSLTIKHIYNGNREDARVILRNVVGMEVYNHSLNNTPGDLTHTISTDHLPAGLYTTELNYNGQSLIKRFSIR